MNRKLYRSGKNKVIAGICGGIGEYLDIDPVVIRVIFLALTVFTGVFPGILFYLLADLYSFLFIALYSTRSGLVRIRTSDLRSVNATL